jgi:aerobic-type carbon monoxide dehydrogenase small subunit (CoxS/CutS family)
VEVAREDISLLEALREDLGTYSVKDGCSPQGQCGCCTVLVDGAPRVSCVTPLRRVAGRAVTTADGLPDRVGRRLTESFLAHGASQCGFCTPGILCRLAGLPDQASRGQVETALLAHLCRCTGWRSIVDAALEPDPTPAAGAGASIRAELEGGTPQTIGPPSVLGRGGFADDTAPPGCLVAVPMAAADRAALEGAAGWSVGATLAEARAGAGKVQGRRSGQPLVHPVAVPPGDWDITLQTTWVEPAYLEPDASSCQPGGHPAPPAANGGAFGGKVDSPAPRAARMLADHLGRSVRVLFSREDVVRFGPKRPPAGAGIRLDGSGTLVLGVAAGQTGIVDRTAFSPPSLEVRSAEISGPVVSTAIRAAGWAEAAVLRAAAAARAAGTTAATVTTGDGAWARAVVELDSAGWPGHVQVEVDAGDPLDQVVLRSYVQGAAHMALGWVCSEGIAVDDEGRPTDLTIRSFGVLRAKDTPPIEVIIRSGEVQPPVKVSDGVFAAVAAATWLAQGLPSRWPTMRGTRR